MEVASRVEQRIGCMDEGLGLTHRQHIEIGEYVAQMLLRHGGSDRARGTATHGND